MDIQKKYSELVDQAALAENMYQRTQSATDWEWFMRCEIMAAEFAEAHHTELFGNEPEEIDLGGLLL